MFGCDSQQLVFYNNKCTCIREFWPIPRTTVGGAEIRRMWIYGRLSSPSDSPLRVKTQAPIPPIRSRIAGLTIQPVIPHKICSIWQSGGVIVLIDSPSQSTCSARESRTAPANYESRRFVVAIHQLASSCFGSVARFINFRVAPSRRRCLVQTTSPAYSRERRRSRRC